MLILRCLGVGAYAGVCGCRSLCCGYVNVGAYVAGVGV